jgi:hypothetical protein
VRIKPAISKNYAARAKMVPSDRAVFAHSKGKLDAWSLFGTYEMCPRIAAVPVGDGNPFERMTTEFAGLAACAASQCKTV